MPDETPAQLDTPAMRQYRSFKEQYPDYILLFRMGDFYEMFYEDAKTASRVLGLALTSRSKGPTAVPLAGIPYHALDNYLARLVQAGHRVALCEQVEDPKQAKGLVERDVTRLVTPGTLTDEALLEQREGNYLAAVFDDKPAADGSRQAGLAWVELSSGAFSAMVVPADHVLDELVRIGPAEVIAPEGSARDEGDFRERLRQATAATPTPPPRRFTSTSARRRCGGSASTAGMRRSRPRGRSSSTSARRSGPPWPIFARFGGSTGRTT